LNNNIDVGCRFAKGGEAIRGKEMGETEVFDGTEREREREERTFWLLMITRAYWMPSR
jgi:hypothetical protein